MMIITDINLATVNIITSISIAASYLPFMNNFSQKSGYPDGCALHAKSLFWPGIFLSLLLLITGIMLFLDFQSGIELSLLAGGMLLFWSILAACYNFQNNIFAAHRGGLFQIILNFLLVAAAYFICLGAYMISRAGGTVG